jgi:hypothetical protein
MPFLKIVTLKGEKKKYFDDLIIDEDEEEEGGVIQGIVDENIVKIHKAVTNKNLSSSFHHFIN